MKWLMALVALMGVCPANAQMIFTIHRDGTGLKELATGLNGVATVKFSPDGSKLVVGGLSFPSRPECGMQSTGPFPTGKVFLMNSDGSNLREIHGYSSAFGPVFTPDGKKILFTSFDESGGTCLAKLLGIYSINLDGTGAAPIVLDATDPNVSRNGSKIVFTKDNFYVYYSNIDGSEPKQLLHAGGGDPIRAAFNPTDSSEIMLYGFEYPSLGRVPPLAAVPPNTKIVTININTSSRNYVLQGTTQLIVTGADYSPDGKTVLYSAFTPTVDHPEIYEVNTDGTGARQVTDASSSGGAYAAATMPAYSPDGKTIVFVGRAH